MNAKAWVGPIAQGAALVLLLGSASWSAGAYAQSKTKSRAAQRAAEPAVEPSDSPVSRARMHFVLGMQFFEVRAYRDAIREFELATSLAPSADVWFNIGRAREELGEHEQAKAAFERYLRDRVDPPDAEAVRARIELIDQHIRSGSRSGGPPGSTGSLRLHFGRAAPEPGTKISLDGKPVRDAQRGQPIILPAGRHRLEVTQPGFIPFRAEVSIESGMLTAAHALLVPLSDSPRAPGSARTWTWVTLGLAGASLIGSGILGAVALDRQADGDVADARTWARRSDVTLAGASVCALAAAILYFIEAEAREGATPSAKRAALTAR